VTFPTTLPAQLGLHSLPGNMAEGVVIKPMRELAVASARSKRPVRALFKHKSDRFAERVREANRARGVAGGRGRAGVGAHALSGLGTRSRLTALISKTGKPNAAAGKSAAAGKGKAGRGGGGGGGRGGGAGAGAGAGVGRSGLVDLFVADVMADAAEDEAVAA